MTESKWQESPEQTKVPVRLVLDKAMLLHAINIARDNDQLEPVPQNAIVEVRIPSGGDYSGMDIEPEEISIRWEKPV